MATIIPLDDLQRQPRDVLRLPGEWKGFLGQVPARSQFTILVAGPSGSGKSTLSMLLAKVFARFGNVIYFCPEEGHQSGTTAIRSRLLGVSSPRIWMYDTTAIADVRALLAAGNCRFAIIDSIQQLDADDTEVLNLIQEFPGVTFVFIAQVDWAEKRSRGSSRWRHAVDIRLWTDVDDEHRRWAYNVKNRYAPTQSRMFLFAPPTNDPKPGNGTASMPTYHDLRATQRTKGQRTWKYSSSSKA